ncbi:peptidoglycan recognition protein family protein [Akkermansiaceae bacterium]|nr:peptidoglycan recognition protein family protein [Akkermansiaceae bacterium]
MGYTNVGKVWTPATLKETLAKTKAPSWCTSVTLHHTASPSLAQRPKGWTVQHMRNLQHFYQKKLGWRAGPHFFTDEDQIFGLSPFTSPGTHARSFNRSSIGIEVLGDYDSEAAKSGRGLQCWKLTAQTTAVLLEWLGKKPNSKTVFFHRDDPKTSKTCPGRKVSKDWVLDLIKGTPTPEEPVTEPSKIESEDKPKIPG